MSPEERRTVAYHEAGHGMWLAFQISHAKLNTHSRPNFIQSLI